MSTTTTPLWHLAASELADAIRRRSISSREAVQSHLDRIEAVNGAVNAVTTTLAEDALAAADAADAQLAAGAEVGPLHGVPFTVKENIDVAGSATTWGAAFLAQQIASEDAPHVANLRAAGGIPIARTNMPDFALRWDTDSGIAGRTKNPWDAGLTAGGSSGGEAAAIATGMTPLGVGNDLGGSLRWPAQCCGISSLKPTLGRVPDAAVTIPTDPTMGISFFNVQGPLARRVADLRVAFEAMTRSSDRDPKYVSPAPTAATRLPRVAVVRDPGGLGVHPDVAAAVDRAARALAAAGYDVEDREPPEVMTCLQGWSALLAADLQVLEPLIVPLMSPDTKAFLDLASAGLPKPEAALIEEAFGNRHRLLREWALFQREHALVLAPIGTQPAFAAESDLDPDGAEAGLMAMRMVVTVNFLGLPAAAVAIPGTPLPSAVQIIGRRFREDLCLDAAEAVEREVGAPSPIDPR
ncbi:MAG TPA: amidase [Candidatus Dormibacteraeota bacterium]